MRSPAVAVYKEVEVAASFESDYGGLDGVVVDVNRCVRAKTMLVQLVRFQVRRLCPSQRPIPNQCQSRCGDLEYLGGHRTHFESRSACRCASRTGLLLTFYVLCVLLLITF